MTIVINILGGPNSSKSTMSALLFAHMKMKNYSVEHVPEFVKPLVWLEDWDSVHNQYYICNNQYKLLKSLDNKVDYIVTDGALLHTLVYNVYNKNNVSNIEKTEERALQMMKEFTNVYIFLDRNSKHKYDLLGRYHTEKQAKDIDRLILEALDNLKLDNLKILADENNINEIIKYIVN